jgi:hypothetical protein
MTQPLDLIKIFNAERAAKLIKGDPEDALAIIKISIGKAESSATQYVIRGDYSAPWEYQAPENRREVLVDRLTADLMAELHTVWLDLLLKIEPGTGVFEPDSLELRAIKAHFMRNKPPSIHRDELTRWAAHMGFDCGLGANTTATAKASPLDEAWKEEARTQARAIIERQAATDWHPNLVVIADEIAKEWRKLGKFGTKGMPLSGGYIKRHALQGHGIGNNRKTIFSTSKGRGK